MVFSPQAPTGAVAALRFGHPWRVGQVGSCCLLSWPGKGGDLVDIDKNGMAKVASF